MARNALLLVISTLLFSCKSHAPTYTAQDTWKLGWRMISNSWDENHEMANSQFDSLLAQKSKIDVVFLKTGLEVKTKLGRNDEVGKIINSLDRKTLQEVCSKEILSSYTECKEIPEETIENPELQAEIILMYFDDQAIRGNVMEKLISKYDIDTSKSNRKYGYDVDDINRGRMKEIIEEYGFPSRSLVGKDAMHGVFLIIQHASGDLEWQISQLPNIELAVDKGDMDGQSYAYLYDRIKMNSGEEQLYGTQFSNVDPVKKVVELAPIEDIENLDARRMKVGMMPIEVYKKLMLRNF